MTSSSIQAKMQLKRADHYKTENPANLSKFPLLLMFRLSLLQGVLEELRVSPRARLGAVLVLLPPQGVIRHLHFVDAQRSPVVSGFLL